MALDSLDVELTVLLGKASLPMHRFLRLGRAAVIALDTRSDDVVEIQANGLAVAYGRIVVDAGTIAIEVTELARNPGVTREPGATIGGPLARRTAAEPEAAAA